MVTKTNPSPGQRTLEIPSAIRTEWPCLDFVNGASRFIEMELQDRYPFLLAWGRQAGWISERQAELLAAEARRRPSRAEAMARRAMRLAEALRGILEEASRGGMPAPRHMSVFNRELSSAMRHARLEPMGAAFEWTWDEDSRALDLILWPVIRSAADLLVSKTRQRVRVCASDTCNWIFMDTSRNGRRRWCDMKICGNRTKVRRYRSRRRVDATDGAVR